MLQSFERTPFSTIPRTKGITIVTTIAVVELSVIVDITYSSASDETSMGIYASTMKYGSLSSPLTVLMFLNRFGIRKRSLLSFTIIWSLT